MIFGSVSSGIEAASVAWGPLGWRPAFFSEIDPFACALLAHYYPDVPNLGDMNGFKGWPDATLDVLCGGTPCQSFSNAGLRAGLDDPRGQLMLVFGAIAARYRPRWLVWENVPGVLSSDDGRDFASFLGLLSGQRIEPPEDGWQSTGVVSGIPDAYGLAWRVLDAQYAIVDGYPQAVPQRRQRVFVVGYLGDWRRAAAVLVEREGLRWDPAPRRSAGAQVAATLTRSADSRGRGGYAGRRQEDDVNLVAGTLGGSGPDAGWRFGPDGACVNHIVAGALPAAHGPNGHGGSGLATQQGAEQGHIIVAAYGGNNTAGPIDVATACRAKGGSGHGDFESETFVAHTLKGSTGGVDREDGHTLIPFDTTQITSAHNRNNPKSGDPCHPLAAQGHPPAIAYTHDGATADTLSANEGKTYTHEGTNNVRLHNVIQREMRVRRLMPVECEKLQGFPPGYTAIPYRGKPAADGPRYKAIGNSWACNVVRWIGQRIELVDRL